MNTSSYAEANARGKGTVPFSLREFWDSLRSARRRTPYRSAACILVFAAALLVQHGLCRAEPPADKPKPEKKAKVDPYAWKSMFDGKTLKGWKVPNFGGQGEVYVKDGAIVMEMGDAMTGIAWKGPLPKTNYEVRLEGMRTMGGDFFCTTTFPIGDEPCSLVVGGWAGTVVGLSCVDWYDASDNITTDFMAFDDEKWYPVRIRVTDAKVECWIDDDKVVDLGREGHKFSIRDEVDLCRPFGISTWYTEGRVRNIRIRRLKPEEVKAAEKQ